MENNHEFVNAQQMAAKYPATFEVPSTDELYKLTVGDYVKVCVADERFWTIVESVDDDTIHASVCNDLVHSHRHGLSLGDEITFTKENIYSIISKDEL